MVERAKILQAVNTAIEKAPERKFSESVDITVNLKNIDMAQPKNRIDETIVFHQLEKQHIMDIVLIQMREIMKRISAMGIKVELTKQAKALRRAAKLVE